MQLEIGGQRYSLAAGEFVIGSDSSASLRLSGAGVLGRHAIARRLNDGMAVVVPASRESEVLLNGTRLGSDPTPVLHGDKLVIAGQEILVVDPGQGGDTRLMARQELAPQSEPAGRLVSLHDGREYAIDTIPFVLGRDAACQVVVTDAGASRRHAEIVPLPDMTVLVDLSSNGTYVADERIQGRRKLERADVIRIGREEFRFYPAHQPATAPEPILSPPAGAEARLSDTMMGVPHRFKVDTPLPTPPVPAIRPLASLLVRSGAMKGERLSVRSPVVNLGRADFNELRIPDASVSTSHAKLQLREGVWVVSDLGSTNGTFVDGERVTEEVAVPPGATLRLGDVALLFEPMDLPGSAGAEGATSVLRAAATPPDAVRRVVLMAQPDASAARGRHTFRWLLIIGLLAIGAFLVTLYLR